MPRKTILEDIKPLSRGTNPAPRARMQAEVTENPAQDMRTPSMRRARTLPREVPFEPIEPPRSHGRGIWYVAALVVVGLLFSLSFLFEHATVTITPKTVPFMLDTSETFTAQKDAVDPDVIVYTVMTLKGDESIKLPSTDKKTLSVAATGQVILYNEYSQGSYSLAKGTRLIAANGKTYRLDRAVVIPGYKKSGKDIVPGSVQTTITASEPGEASNIDRSDFTLPGFSGTPQYTKIYGRSKTALSGGVSGTVYTLPATAADSAASTLKDKLQASLLAKAKVQVPDGYLLYEKATVFTPDDVVQVPYSREETVPISISGSLTAYLIKEDTLTRAITKGFVSQYAGEPVRIPQLGSMTLAPQTTLVPASDTSMTFTLSGGGQIVWQVTTSDIAKLIAGQRKKEIDRLLADVIGIDQADVVLKPFWKQSFPEDTARITVLVKQPGA
jgi:hypothetical protein